MKYLCETKIWRRHAATEDETEASWAGVTDSADWAGNKVQTEAPGGSLSGISRSEASPQTDNKNTGEDASITAAGHADGVEEEAMGSPVEKESLIREDPAHQERHAEVDSIFKGGVTSKSGAGAIKSKEAGSENSGQARKAVLYEVTGGPNEKQTVKTFEVELPSEAEEDLGQQSSSASTEHVPAGDCTCSASSHLRNSPCAGKTDHVCLLQPSSVTLRKVFVDTAVCDIHGTKTSYTFFSYLEKGKERNHSCR